MHPDSTRCAPSYFTKGAHFGELQRLLQARHHYVYFTVNFVMEINAGMRERSPPLPNISHPSHPVWAIAGFNKAKCNAESPPGGTACLITVSPVPGKLASTAAHWFILGLSACGFLHSRRRVETRGRAFPMRIAELH